MRTSCAAASFSRARRTANFWSLNGYYFQGLRPFDDQDTIPVALPLGGDPAGQRPDALGLLLHRRFQRPGADPHQGPGHAADLEPGRLDPALMSGRSATSTGSTSACAATSTTRKATRSTFESDGGNNTRGPRAAALHRPTGAGRSPTPTGTWVHEVEPMVSVNVAPTWGNTRKIPNEDSSDFEFDETNLFEPVRFPGLDRVDTGTRVAYGLRFSSLGPRATEFSGSFGQSYSFTDELVHPAGVRRPGQSVRLCRRVLRAAQRAARPQLPLPARQGRPEVPPQRRAGGVRPGFLRFNLGYVNLSQEPRGVRRRQQQLVEPDRVRIRARRSRRRARSSSPTSIAIGGADPPRPERQPRPSPTRSG